MSLLFQLPICKERTIMIFRNNDLFMVNLHEIRKYKFSLQIPTSELVLRGRYSAATVAVFGYITTVVSECSTPPPPPPPPQESSRFIHLFILWDRL